MLMISGELVSAQLPFGTASRQHPNIPQQDPNFHCQMERKTFDSFCASA